MSHLSQAEADAFIAMLKNVIGQPIHFDYTKKTIVLENSQHRKDFLLDIIPNRVRPNKITNQLRVNKNVLLVRLDVNGPPHRNPDDSEIPCPHLHVYREGYDLKWAYPIPEIFGDCQTLMDFLDSFCSYCNINGKIFHQLPLELSQ